MGKKTGSGGLGRSLMKDKRAKNNRMGTSLLHTSEMNDGQDWNRINLQSITEQTHVDEFLATAELAGTEFQAEKLNMKFVRPTTQVGMLTEEEKRKIRAAQEANREMLSIPRRPPWDMTTTPEQLAEAERSSFLSWRRNLAKLQEVEGITLTPFERNLEFWRQLWRVIERSDVVVQILDARNPLLFRCEDLEAYVKEVDPNKENVLLINKSDLLTEVQREMWAKYFRGEGIKAVFFSALSGEELDAIREEEEQARNTPQNQRDRTRLDSETNEREEIQTANVEECRQDLEILTVKLKKQNESIPSCQSGVEEESSSPTEDTGCHPNSSMSHPNSFIPSSNLLSRSELIEVFRVIYTKHRLLGKTVTIGLVGYPNVGKSSTINCLMQGKKVSVSATPGKTKHFQTLYLAEDILLCDCPGLVFPAFITTKQEMIISGILPIDQMRDEVPPINLVASRIPRDVLESTYGITLPQPMEGEDSNRPPTSEELLNSYGFMRGFMTQRGMPDNPRSARYILKDYVNGKLLYAHAPPSIPQAEYHTHTVSQMKKRGHVKLTPQQIATQPYKVKPEAVDVKFFGAATPHYHIKGINTGGMTQTKNGPVAARQPRQKNFKKREKLRRRFAHLDE